MDLTLIIAIQDAMNLVLLTNQDGLHEADPRTRSFPVRVLIPTKATSPRSYTWSIGSILDQGSTSSCVGHAVAHRLIARPVVRPEITGKDALEFYSLAQALDPWEGEEYEGTSILAGAKAAKQKDYITVPTTGRNRWMI